MKTKTLREWRAERLWTQRELAERSGNIRQATVAGIESGVVPRFSTMRKVSDALEVAPSQIMEFAEAIAIRSGRQRPRSKDMDVVKRPHVET